MLDLIELSPEFLAPAVALVILAGSLVGSTLIFIISKPAPPPDQSFGLRRPTDWPSRSEGVKTYHAAQASEPRASLPWLGMTYAAAVAFLGGTAALTVYQSPWEPVVTLRHMAATLHCDLADQVGLSPSRVGEPGYHVRNDRDRNGTACEVFTPATAVADATVVPQDGQTEAQPALSASADTAVIAGDPQP